MGYCAPERVLGCSLQHAARPLTIGLCVQIQTVGFITHLWKKLIHGPFLVIAPLSTLTNWEAEFKKWAPSVPALLYHGNKQERQKMRSSKMPRSE